MSEIELQRTRSRELETEIYTTAMRDFYVEANTSAQSLYDRAFELTNGFRSGFRDAILTDSRLIKIFRYSIVPAISQMKFGQLVGLSSVAKFEAQQLTEGRLFQRLLASADDIANYIEQRIDNDRFTWRNEANMQGDRLTCAQSFARKWTCSLIAHQNADTQFRNWRKERQESAIKGYLLGKGFAASSFTGVVESYNDIKTNEFAPETRVKGRTRQKADVVVRTGSGGLVLIEAKAVGVEIDATKRVKECCDKASDWGSSPNLNSPVIVAVIAGFFTESNIESLTRSGVHVVWEHDLDKLGDLL